MLKLVHPFVHKYLLSICDMASIVLGSWRYSREPDKNTYPRREGKQASRRHTSDGEGAKGQGCHVGAVNIGPVRQQRVSPAEKREREFCCEGRI